MKKIAFLALALITIVVASCNQQPGKGAQQKSASEEFIGGLTNEDSVQMMKICDECMMQLKQGNLNAAMAMLCEYDDSTHSVLPLSDEKRMSYMRMFTLFPVLDYKCVETTFMEEGLNNVKYEFVFAHEDNPEENGVPKTAVMFNPVKVGGVWHLTIKRPDQKLSLDPSQSDSNDAEVSEVSTDSQE